MNTSTPQSAGRSQSTSSDGVFVSPSTKSQHLTMSSTPVLESFPGNDDDQERKQRRRSRVIDLQLSSTESPLSMKSISNRSAETSMPMIPKLTNIQISDHYSTCIKLSTENRITTKNAFGLHLIDYMAEILKQKDSEMTNFKIAAGTLDASTKIYAVRVDAVHADVYRVLGGLGKDSAPPRDVDSQGADGAAAGTEAAPKPQTKKKHLYKTIEQNLNNINASEADRRSEVDPMFQKTAASFDECSTAGIFLSTLHARSHCCELLLESQVTPLPSSETLESPSSTRVKVADVKSILLQCTEQRPICPTLSGFQFTQWDSDSHNESASALLDRFKKSDQAFDINAEVDCDPADCADDIVDDDFDADLPERTVAVDLGEFSDNLKACRVVRESMRQDVLPFGEGDIGTMCLHLSVKPGEYSYFSPRTMSLWAGPEHWCFKPLHKSDLGAEKSSKKRNTKRDFELRFDEDVDFDTHFRKTRAATTLAPATLDKQSKKSTTLPADFHYDPDNIIRLALKPAVKLWRTAVQSSSAEPEDEISEYDYNNPNDASNFCPALQAAASDDDDDPRDSVGPGGTFELTVGRAAACAQLSRVLAADIVTYGEGNLVAEPQKVNKIEIHYAKMAKKMDMKRLKQTMWDLLTDAQKQEVKVEDEVAGRTDSATVAGEKVFSGITKDLLHRLPSVMAQNLSVPLAFACLLHLANEKNLKLEGAEDLSDVFVKQGD